MARGGPRSHGGRGRTGTAPSVLVVVQNIPFELDRRVRSECAALVAAGYRVSVICPQAEPTDAAVRTIDGVAVHGYPVPATRPGVLGYLVEFVVCWVRTALLSVRVARTRGFDVLQACNPPDTFWLLGLLWKLTGRRFVYDQHDLCPEVYEARFGRRGLLHRGLVLLERATYRTADHVISTNPSYQEVARRRGRLEDSRSSVVMSTPDRRMVRGEIEPQLRRGRRHLVCYVGIMGPQDGVDRLVDAIHHYVHVMGRGDAHFCLLGYGDSLEELRRQAARLRLGDDVLSFTGRVGQAEIGRWLSAGAVGVTPDPVNEFNHRSTMNKTLEYMAHGVPVVATDLRETRRCAQDAALYVGDGSPAALAAGVAELLDDPIRRRRMGRTGRVRIERDLAWQVQADTYLGVFDGLLGRTVSPDRTAAAVLPRRTAGPDGRSVQKAPGAGPVRATIEFPGQRRAATPARTETGT